MLKYSIYTIKNNTVKEKLIAINKNGLRYKQKWWHNILRKSTHPGRFKKINLYPDREWVPSKVPAIILKYKNKDIIQ